MNQLKILAVAPYEGMADIIRECAAKRDDVEMTVQTGDLYRGKEIAKELAHKNYDVIISRGGTAELIRAAVETPVIDIPISGYDILRAIKLAESYSGKFVIAGFHGITENARMLCDLLQYDIDILTFTDDNDAVPALKAAMKRGAALALCDMTGCAAAKKLGMNAILISSGTESVDSAIGEAVKLARSSLFVRKQKELFQNLLTDTGQDFLIYDPSGALWFSSLAIDGQNDSLMNLVNTYLNAFLKVSGQSVARQIRDKVYTLTSRHLYYDDQKYTAIIIQQKEALLNEGDAGIRIYNKTEQPVGDYLNYYSSSNQVGDMSRIIEEYSKSRLPVLILGETGTGKDKVAALIYENGPFDHFPFYMIDCEFMSERKWSSLLSSDSSPLSTLHSTIYFKNPAALSREQLEKLFTYIDHSGLSKRSRLIFSLIENSGEYPEAGFIRNHLETSCSCLTLKLLPLRSRTEDLSSIMTLYLHRLNMSMGKQIIGFEAEAMELMTAFPWPKNLDQLYHVLRELMLLTRSSYITSSDVRQILAQEQQAPPPSATGLDLNLTLDELNYQIIQMVLSEEKGNKEKTSQRLGISRSTLWRILKNHKGNPA